MEEKDNLTPSKKIPAPQPPMDAHLKQGIIEAISKKTPQCPSSGGRMTACTCIYSLVQLQGSQQEMIQKLLKEARKFWGKPGKSKSPTYTQMENYLKERVQSYQGKAAILQITSDIVVCHNAWFRMTKVPRKSQAILYGNILDGRKVMAFHQSILTKVLSNLAKSSKIDWPSVSTAINSSIPNAGSQDFFRLVYHKHLKPIVEGVELATPANTTLLNFLNSAGGGSILDLSGNADAMEFLHKYCQLAPKVANKWNKVGGYSQNIWYIKSVGTTVFVDFALQCLSNKVDDEMKSTSMEFERLLKSEIISLHCRLSGTTTSSNAIAFEHSMLWTRFSKSQKAHIDFRFEEVEQHKGIYLIFFPVTEEGMWIQFWKDSDKGNGTLVFIPFGKAVIASGKILHCGGFKSGKGGNLRGHIYAYIGVKPEYFADHTNTYVRDGHDLSEDYIDSMVIADMKTILDDACGKL